VTFGARESMTTDEADALISKHQQDQEVSPSDDDNSPQSGTSSWLFPTSLAVAPEAPSEVADAVLPTIENAVCAKTRDTSLQSEALADRVTSNHTLPLSQPVEDASEDEDVPLARVDRSKKRSQTWCPGGRDMGATRSLDVRHKSVDDADDAMEVQVEPPQRRSSCSSMLSATALDEEAQAKAPKRYVSRNPRRSYLPRSANSSTPASPEQKHLGLDQLSKQSSESVKSSPSATVKSSPKATPSPSRTGSKLRSLEQTPCPAYVLPDSIVARANNSDFESSSESSGSAVAEITDRAMDTTFRKNVEERLDTIYEELEAMNEGVAEDVGSLREEVSQLTRLMHQLLERFDADERY